MGVVRENKDQLVISLLPVEIDGRCCDVSEIHTQEFHGADWFQPFIFQDFSGVRQHFSSQYYRFPVLSA